MSKQNVEKKVKHGKLSMFDVENTSKSSSTNSGPPGHRATLTVETCGYILACIPPYEPVLHTKLIFVICDFNVLQSKPDSSELGSPKTTDDIVQERGEEGRVARRRHKTENVKQPWSQEKALAVELEQTQR